MPKRTRKNISGRRENNVRNYIRNKINGLDLLARSEMEREEEGRKKNSLCSKLKGKCSIQGGSLMSGGSILQQTFGDDDTSTGALDKANNQQKAAGEEALRIRNEENQKGGFASDFMPHPSMTSDQAQTQKGIADTSQQGEANAEFDKMVPKANQCLRNQAGAGRKSIFSRNKKSLFRKKRTKSLFKKKRTKRKGKTKKRKTTRKYMRKSSKRRRRRGGKSKRKRRMPKYRFSQRAPLKV